MHQVPSLRIQILGLSNRTQVEATGCYRYTRLSCLAVSCVTMEAKALLVQLTAEGERRTGNQGRQDRALESERGKISRISRSKREWKKPIGSKEGRKARQEAEVEASDCMK